MKPYFDAGDVQLYQGDMRQVLPELDLQADCVVTDPPYGETALSWDRWPDGWPAAAAAAARSMWCFGSMCATDGTPNAASMLYASAWRASKALGFRRLVTYTQLGESGASLRAAGWATIAERPPRPGWNRPSRPREPKGTENVQRYLWEQSEKGAA